MTSTSSTPSVGSLAPQGTPFSYKELRALVAIAESRNLTHAAAVLGCSKVTVQTLTSILTEKLERVLGRPCRLYLYSHERHAVELTPDAIELYEHARAAVADIEHLDITLAASGIPEPTLRVTAPESLLEQGLLERLVGGLSRIGYEPPLEVLNRGSDGGLRMLLAHECHVAFVGAARLESAHLAARFHSVEYRAFPVHLYVAADRHDRLREALDPDLEACANAEEGAAGRLLAGLSRQCRLILPGTWSAFRRYVADRFAQHRAPLDVSNVTEFDSRLAKLKAIGLGLGAGLMWEQAEPEEPEGIKRIDLAGAVPPWRYFAVYHARRLSEPARAMLDEICGAA